MTGSDTFKDLSNSELADRLFVHIGLLSAALPVMDDARITRLFAPIAEAADRLRQPETVEFTVPETLVFGEQLGDFVQIGFTKNTWGEKLNAAPFRPEQFLHRADCKTGWLPGLVAALSRLWRGR